MGAAGFLYMNQEEFSVDKYITRPASAASATGFAKQHAQQQKELIVDKAFDI
jgi:2-oxoglutarate dehydrogenase complex dehydrogenase (E1) component-like enzyme